MNKTVEQWLALGDDLPVELARVFTPGPWKHDWDACGHNAHNKCQKCGKAWASSNNAIKRNFSCPIPGPIDIKDWKVAMEWRDKAVKDKDPTMFTGILLECFGGGIEGDIDACFANAQPKHYLIAAAMAAERSKE